MSRFSGDHELYDQIMEHLPEVIWVSDSSWTQLFYVSPSYEKTWGRSAESLYASPGSWLDTVLPEDRERISQMISTKSSLREHDEQFRILRPDGRIRWIRARSFPFPAGSDQTPRIVGIAQDITETRILELSLRQSENRLSGILSIAADAVVSADGNQRIILFNKGAEQSFGYSAEEVIGQPLDMLMPGRLASLHRDHVQKFGAGASASRLMGNRDCEIIGRRKDGSEFPAAASISKWKRNHETIYTAIVRDVTESRKAEEMIRRLAYYDTLTGLANRTSFSERIEEALLRISTDGTALAVLLLDLDQFKEINNTLGHHRGDLLLRRVARRLQTALGPTDTLARLGGDEFGVILPMTAARDAAAAARKIRTALEEPFEVDGFPVAVETSIGIALAPDHGEDTATLIQRADVAMYAAKRKAVGYAFYSADEDSHNPEWLTLLGQLRRALEDDKLFLVYQPIVDLRSGRTTGVEALIRWDHPFFGPAQFIEPAEQTGLIHPLTQFAIREALRQCKEWHEAGWMIHVGVNLSVRNLQDPGLKDWIRLALEAAGLEPKWLQLEITESALMIDAERAMSTLAALSRIGVCFALDDFGVGFSSLAYLQKLPVGTVKIDRSFVKNLAGNACNEAIVRSAIELGHNLGKQVVAEGVEEADTLQRLTALGCDLAQGYHISRPLSAKDLSEWLSRPRLVPSLDQIQQ